MFDFMNIWRFNLTLLQLSKLLDCLKSVLRTGTQSLTQWIFIWLRMLNDLCDLTFQTLILTFYTWRCYTFSSIKQFNRTLNLRLKSRLVTQNFNWFYLLIRIKHSLICSLQIFIITTICCFKFAFMSLNALMIWHRLYYLWAHCWSNTTWSSKTVRSRISVCTTTPWEYLLEHVRKLIYETSL